MEIKRDDLTGSEIADLLREHLENMAEDSPPESMHALSLEELRNPDITFWSVWNGPELLGCGALKELDPQHGEIKSMRTASAHRRKGGAARLLEHILEVARQRKYKWVSLKQDRWKPSPRHTACTRSLVSNNAGRLRTILKTRIAYS